MSKLKINMRDLAYPCTTRTRAKEAIDKLRDMINDESVLLDLTLVDSISLSFLDEFIYWMAGSGSVRKIMFVTDDELIHGKLSRVADIRKNTFIKYQLTNGQIHEILPKPIEPISAKFVPTKKNANSKNK